jgi:hypothetical protein
MPGDLELSPTDKHIFIEEVIGARLHSPPSLSLSLSLSLSSSFELTQNIFNAVASEYIE